jgi:KUP system potassium uptake protein
VLLRAISYRYGWGAWAALNPWYAIRLFHEDFFRTWRMLGGVTLAITGAEAMYADLGHFSKGSVKVGRV